jgi:hypothetical protein
MTGTHGVADGESNDGKLLLDPSTLKLKVPKER